MENWQFTILISAVTGGLGGLIKAITWSVKRLTAALDSNTQAHFDSVKAMTRMSTQLDFVYQATGRVDEFIKEETSKNYEINEDITPGEIPSKKKEKTTYMKVRKNTPI